MLRSTTIFTSPEIKHPRTIESSRIESYRAVPHVINRVISRAIGRATPPKYDITAKPVKSSNRQIADLMKIYSQADKTQLYSEKQYNHFKEKYIFFKDICYKL